MAKDYIPSKDSDLLAYGSNFYNTANVDAESFGLTIGQLTELSGAKNAFDNAFAAIQTTQSAARVARQNKDNAKSAYIAKLRELAKIVQANPIITDAQRADLQITIPDRVPTAVSAPTSHPVIAVDFSKRREHRISATDSLTPFSKAKPSGATGFALWRKMSADQPADVSTMEFIGVISSGSHRLEFEESQIGQTAWYVGCWQTATGKRSPFGSFESATVAK